MAKHVAVTVDAHGNPTSTPQPKVVAASIGAGLGIAITTIGVYLLETSIGVDIPELVEGAIVVVVSAAISFLAGYVKAPSDKAH